MNRDADVKKCPDFGLNFADISSMKLELISFDLCPYVQRSVITMKQKKAEFALTFIDLEDPPQWFPKLSPLGKVPVLKVDGTVLFESAVINEYLDETIPPQFHPADPLRKAFERSWIEFGSELLRDEFQLFHASEKKEIEKAKDELFQDMLQLKGALEKRTAPGPYFRGKDFSLVDAAIAPFFVRLFLSREIRDDRRWNEIPEVKAWGEFLTQLPSVKESVIPGFERKFISFCKEAGSPLFD